jgi:hypothetical protein
MRTEFYCFSGLLFIMSTAWSRWGDPTSRKARDMGHPAFGFVPVSFAVTGLMHARPYVRG